MGSKPPPLNLEVLTHRNLLLYAARNYENRHCLSTEEFIEDLSRIKHVKKLITRYEKNGDLKIRLILNHIMVLNNCFGPEATPRILYLKMRDYMPYVAPCLIQLNIWPEILWNVGAPGAIYTDTVPLNQTIVDALRKL